jgi:hypothetical protein
MPFASHREYVTYLDGALHTPTFTLEDDDGEALCEWLDGEVAGSSRGLVAQAGPNVLVVAAQVEFFSRS